MSTEAPAQKRWYPVLFMFIVTLVFITVVSALNLWTRDTVKLNEFLFLKRAILYAADIEIPQDAAVIEDVFQMRVKEVRDAENRLKFYRILSQAGTDTEGFAVLVDGPGLWGEIEAVIGFSHDLSKTTGIDFIKQSETPGLGARISEEWFKSQFRNRKGPFELVPEGTSQKSAEIDAITGATITSTAVRNMINRTVENVAAIIGKN